MQATLYKIGRDNAQTLFIWAFNRDDAIEYCITQSYDWVDLATPEEMRLNLDAPYYDDLGAEVAQ